jgi:bacteriocin-like protein
LNNLIEIELTDEQLENITGGQATHFEYENYKHEVTEYEKLSYDRRDHWNGDNGEWDRRRHHGHRHCWN